MTLWNPALPDRLGYRKKITTVRSLRERFQLAISYHPEEVRRLLKRNSVSYRIDTEMELMQFVAFLDKPLAELLDDLQVPRERIEWEFVEFHGPVIPDPTRYMVRKVVPSLIKQPRGFTVQSMTAHIEDLPIMLSMKLSIDGLSI